MRIYIRQNFCRQLYLIIHTQHTHNTHTHSTHVLLNTYSIYVLFVSIEMNGLFPVIVYLSVNIFIKNVASNFIKIFI